MVKSKVYQILLQSRLLLLALLLAIGSIPPSHAQSNVHYFPQTGHFVKGGFLTFWQQNHGLQNFGFPITEEFVSSTTGRTTQYFERARFEIYLQDNKKYIVLGNIGKEIVGTRTFPRAEPIVNTTQQRYIPETGYIIQYGFKEIWETRGADQIFGWPISNELEETIMDGSVRTVQYFERARFEYWPEYAPGQRVVISSLGRLLAPPELVPPLPPNAEPGTVPQAVPQTAQTAPGQYPPAAASPPPAPIPTLPPNDSANVIPVSGPPGTVFTFYADGFKESEKVSLWLTAPDKTVLANDAQPRADGDGSIAYADIDISSDNFAEGIWAVTAQGLRSGKQAVAYFYVTGGAEAPTQSQTQMSTVSNIPQPTGNCANNAPTPAEGVQAWIPDTNTAPGSKVRVCTRLIIGGEVIRGAEARGVVHFEAHDEWIGPENTSHEDGIASIQFDVDDNVDPDYTIRVNTEVIYNDKSYFAETRFTPSETATTSGTTADCSPFYPEVCIPSPPPDLDCSDIPYRRFLVLDPDPHKFDGDGDHIGCEDN